MFGSAGACAKTGAAPAAQANATTTNGMRIESLRVDESANPQP